MNKLQKKKQNLLFHALKLCHQIKPKFKHVVHCEGIEVKFLRCTS